MRFPVPPARLDQDCHTRSCHRVPLTRSGSGRDATVRIPRTLRKITAFFWRDFSIARGYRGALVLETLEALFGVATFFYLSRFVESPQLESALPAGSNYFAFALVGFAFFDYLSVALTAF